MPREQRPAHAAAERATGTGREGKGGGKRTNEDEEAALHRPGIEGDSGDEDAPPEHGGELGVRQGQGPEAEVGGSVGDGAKDELDGFNALVHKQLAESVLLVFLFVCSARASALLRLGREGE